MEHERPRVVSTPQKVPTPWAEQLLFYQAQGTALYHAAIKQAQEHAAIQASLDQRQQSLARQKEAELWRKYDHALSLWHQAYEHWTLAVRLHNGHAALSVPQTPQGVPDSQLANSPAASDAQQPRNATSSSQGQTRGNPRVDDQTSPQSNPESHPLTAEQAITQATTARLAADHATAAWQEEATHAAHAATPISGQPPVLPPPWLRPEYLSAWHHAAAPNPAAPTQPAPDPTSQTNSTSVAPPAGHTPATPAPSDTQLPTVPHPARSAPHHRRPHFFTTQPVSYCTPDNVQQLYQPAALHSMYATTTSLGRRGHPAAEGQLAGVEPGRVSASTLWGPGVPVGVDQQGAEVAAGYPPRLRLWQRDPYRTSMCDQSHLVQAWVDVLDTGKVTQAKLPVQVNPGAQPVWPGSPVAYHGPAPLASTGSSGPAAGGWGAATAEQVEPAADGTPGAMGTRLEAAHSDAGEVLLNTAAAETQSHAGVPGALANSGTSTASTGAHTPALNGVAEPALPCRRSPAADSARHSGSAPSLQDLGHRAYTPNGSAADSAGGVQGDTGGSGTAMPLASAGAPSAGYAGMQPDQGTPVQQLCEGNLAQGTPVASASGSEQRSSSLSRSLEHSLPAKDTVMAAPGWTQEITLRPLGAGVAEERLSSTTTEAGAGSSTRKHSGGGSPAPAYLPGHPEALSQEHGT